MALTKTRAGAEPGADEGNRRQLLVRVAGRLFREKGFDATTTRDIADAAGMRSGSPFYHFRNKQELLCTVMLVGLENACGAIEAVLAEADDDDEACFRLLVRRHLETILAPDSDFAVLLSEWRSLAKESRAAVVAVKNRYEELWAPVIERLGKAGRLRGEPRLRRLFVFGALNWAVQWYRPDGQMSLTEIADSAVDFMLSSPTLPRGGGQGALSR